MAFFNTCDRDIWKKADRDEPEASSERGCSAMSTTLISLLFGVLLLGFTSGSQRFNYDTTWQACFASKSAQQGHPSRSECEERSMVMDLICIGPALSLKKPPPPTPSATGLVMTDPRVRCYEGACPDTHECVDGIISQCCSKEYRKLRWEVAEAQKCPDGSKAGGELKGDKFWATIGSACDDVECGEGEKCVQVNKFFAKCCGAK
uniref:Dickkopf_N domain-containing protein n=1 Tax=Steinernema glaseri TaxID=37863 RepID=A0A1I8ATA0_9BILA